jgi:hypothetical protein
VGWEDRPGMRLSGTKITGDPNVPALAVSFVADIQVGLGHRAHVQRPLPFLTHSSPAGLCYRPHLDPLQTQVPVQELLTDNRPLVAFPQGGASCATDTSLQRIEPPFSSARPHLPPTASFLVCSLSTSPAQAQ